MNVPMMRVRTGSTSEYLRTIRRRAEHRTEKLEFVTISLLSAPETHKYAQLHIEKHARKCSRDFCAKLDLRQPSTRTWRLMLSLSNQQHHYRFRSFALTRKFSEKCCAEHFCVTKSCQFTTTVDAPTSTPRFLTVVSRNPLDLDFRSHEFDSTSPSCVRASTTACDGINYASLVQLFLKA